VALKGPHNNARVPIVFTRTPTVTASHKLLSIILRRVLEGKTVTIIKI